MGQGSLGYDHRISRAVVKFIETREGAKNFVVPHKTKGDLLSEKTGGGWVHQPLARSRVNPVELKSPVTIHWLEREGVFRPICLNSELVGRAMRQSKDVNDWKVSFKTFSNR